MEAQQRQLSQTIEWLKDHGMTEAVKTAEKQLRELQKTPAPTRLCPWVVGKTATPIPSHLVAATASLLTTHLLLSPGKKFLMS